MYQEQFFISYSRKDIEDVITEDNINDYLITKERLKKRGYTIKACWKITTKTETRTEIL